MSNLPSLARQRRDLSVDAVVSAFESDTQAVILRTSPRSEHLSLYVLLAMVFVGLVLMSVTKLDIVVAGDGRTVGTEGSFYVQPFDKGIVRAINVKVGDVVKKGEVLATLDPTFASADVAKFEQTLASAEADKARLEAEQSGQPYHPDAGGQYELLQEAIYQQRQSLYRSSVANFDAQIGTGESAIARLKQDAETYNQRLKVSSDVEKMRAQLQQMGWGSKLEALSATDARLEIERLKSFSTNQIAETQHTVDSLKAQRATFIGNWSSEIAQWLANDRNTIAQVKEDLAKANRAHDLVNITAPTDAYVLKIGKASVGGIVGTGAVDAGSDPLFTLVPVGTPLEVEMAVEAKDIGFIRVGDAVTVKFAAYQFIRYGTAKGVIKSISSDSFTTDYNNQVAPPYYKARVALTDVHLHDVPSTFALMPGMTLTADIMAGRRTILSYLLEGALRRASEAMREP
ncbi:MAG TPA: HlyD family type I secretion periplasmic adaptor subunit [Stellaceae bacterium]|nr:HlyD family type I secretion periplasmic adaptor subunit [Stellaceae bacterium]